jgi:hypothetical protein
MNDLVSPTTKRYCNSSTVRLPGGRSGLMTETEFVLDILTLLQMRA